MRYRTLGRCGPLISELGFSASPLGGIYGTFAEQDGIGAVHSALDAGINFLDVSPYYGLTVAETILGKALRGIDRDRYVLATKVGRYGDKVFDFSAPRVARSVRESMGRLGVRHIDLIQCHDVEFGSLDQIVEETIPVFRALQDSRLIRWVGITGYPLPALLHIASRTGVDTVMSYCQYTLQDRRLAACAADLTATGAVIINASPLAMGAFTERGAPPWHPAPCQVRGRGARAAALCHDRGASLEKLALQFSVTTSLCVTTVVGSAGSRPGLAERSAREPESRPRVMTGHVLDSHLYLIDPCRLDYSWIKRGDDLDQKRHPTRFAGEALQVTGAIVVEGGVVPGQVDREIPWVRAEAARHPWIGGLVAQLPVERASALAAGLSEFRSDDLIAGVRRNLQDEPAGYLADPGLRAGVRRLGAFGLPFDACVRSWQLTELTELAAACPGTVIVLDHLGKPRCGTDLTSWHRAITVLAALPHARCKLSGLATEAATAARDDLVAALRAALDAFGAERCLYGGDWPVCTLATSPDAWLDVVLAALYQAGASDTEREDVLTPTALRTYRLRPISAAPSEGARK